MPGTSALGKRTPVLGALPDRSARAVRAVGNRVVAIGDSEIFNNDGGWFKQLCQRAGQRGLYSGHFATQGYTIEQIRDTHLPSVLALSGNRRPAACAIMAGTNNVGANSGGGIGTGWSFSAAQAAYAQITSGLVTAGILPILCTIPPRGDVTLANTNVRQWNAYLTMLAAIRGWPLLDMHGPVVSAAGQWSTLSSGDNIHYNGQGFRLASAANASTFANLFQPGGPYLSKSQPDPINLLPNGNQLFGSAATGGVAGNWSASATGGQVFAVDSTDTSIFGNWQEMSRPSAATANVFFNVGGSFYATTGFAVGDTVAVAFLFQALSFEANINQSATATLDFRDSGSSTIGNGLRALYSNISDMTATTVAYADGVVPAGCTKIGLSASVNGAATTTNGAKLRLAQPTIINLTALGLA